MINKGIVFVGDSYTWGHGLWQYYPNDKYFKEDDITEAYSNNPALEEFHKANRWPRLVANNYSTFERCRKFTAGSDYESLSSLSQFFNDGISEFQGPMHDNEFPLRYRDVSYVIFGTSYIDRCPFITPRLDLHYLEEVTPDLMLSFGFDDVNDFLDYHKRYYFYKIKTKLMYVEKQGVNTLIWNVTNTYKKLFEQDEWMSKRLIKLNYKNDSEDYIVSLMKKYDELVLSKDKYFQKFQKRNPPDDGHPSLMAQKVIANSVINAMENRNSEGW